MITRTKPNGETTSDMIEYCDAWHEIADPICEATGYNLLGYDPCLTFGDPAGGLPVQMPVEFAEKIAKLIKNKKG